MRSGRRRLSVLFASVAVPAVSAGCNLIVSAGDYTVDAALADDAGSTGSGSADVAVGPMDAGQGGHPMVEASSGPRDSGGVGRPRSTHR